MIALLTQFLRSVRIYMPLHAVLAPGAMLCVWFCKAVFPLTAAAAFFLLFLHTKHSGKDYEAETTRSTLATSCLWYLVKILVWGDLWGVHSWVLFICSVVGTSFSLR